MSRGVSVKIYVCVRPLILLAGVGPENKFDLGKMYLHGYDLNWFYYSYFTSVSTLIL